MSEGDPLQSIIPDFRISKITPAILAVLFLLSTYLFIFIVSILFDGLRTSYLVLPVIFFGIFVLFRYYTISAALFGYIAILALTAFIAGVGVEEGGYLFETDIFGSANNSFVRLAAFYIFFFIVLVFFCEKPLTKKTANLDQVWRSNLASNDFQALFGVCVAATFILAGLLAGLKDGFAYFEQVNRYQVRNAADGLGEFLFNLYLNNRVFIAFILGSLVVHRSAYYRKISLLLISFAVFLSVIHGEQFMATLQLCVSILFPVALHQLRNGGINKIVVFGVLAVALIIGMISLYAAYASQGFEFDLMLQDRLALQSQLWFAVDLDASIFKAPPGGGQDAFLRFLYSLGDFDFSSYVGNYTSPSGLSELMLTYGVPSIVAEMFQNKVTFTMGQMAVPVYWFGTLGGLVFCIASAAFCGYIGSALIRALSYGSVVSIWLGSKIHTFMTFGLQQGEYWYVYGLRNLVFVFILLILMQYETRKR